jgi:alpha-ketoglutarate-dependent taurine dioxygenase
MFGAIMRANRSSRESLSVTLELNKLADLSAESALQQRFREDLDRSAVARIVLATQPSAEEIVTLARLFGELESPEVYGTPVVPNSVVGDFSAPAKVDDGRPRQRSFIENLHVDVLQSGWASYGILHTRRVPPAEPMLWVDMRAVYRKMPAELQQRLRTLRGAQYRRATRSLPRTAAFEHPLVAAHPRTAEPMLLLPDRVQGSIVGLDLEQSRTLLGELWRTVDEAAACQSYELRSGELYVWDNLATVHSNPAFPRAHERSVWFLNAGCVAEVGAHP